MENSKVINNEISSTDEFDYEHINKTSYIKVSDLLNELEKKLNITILYACETGSRANGVAVKESDFDVKGFYVAKEEEYLRVIRSVNPVYINHHIKLEIFNKEYDFDIELRDIGHYFSEKILKNAGRSDFWFKSEIIYINKFPLNFFSTIDNYLTPPVFIFSPDDKSGLKTLEKNIQKHGYIFNKKLLSLLISAIQYLHTEIYQTTQSSEGENTNKRNFDKFPHYNIFKEIQYLIDNHNVFHLIFTEDEISLIYKNFELVEGLYTRKKQGRLSTTKSIPENITKFINMLTSKFKPQIKRKGLNLEKCLLPLDWSQDIFEEFLYQYNTN